METTKTMIKIGPVGQRSGTQWDAMGWTEIVQIFISHGDRGIQSIQFQCAAANGTDLVLSSKFGGGYARKFDVVKLNYPSEYITWVGGHESDYGAYVRSLQFGTNEGTYGPYGISADRSPGNEFRFQLGQPQDRQFGGFYGTFGQSLNSIGVYLKPITTLAPRPRK